MNRSFAFEIRILFPKYFLEYFRCAGEWVAADCAFFLGDHHKESVERFLGDECREIRIYFLLKGNFIIGINDGGPILGRIDFLERRLDNRREFLYQTSRGGALEEGRRGACIAFDDIHRIGHGHLLDSVDEDIFGGFRGILRCPVHRENGVVGLLVGEQITDFDAPVSADQDLGGLQADLERLATEIVVDITVAAG